MKATVKIFTALIFVTTFLFTSCRTEEMEVINPAQEETLTPNSTIANLMQRTATNDGSNDNIIDHSNCFNIQLPFTIFVNGVEIIVDSEDDLETVEDILDEFDDDEDMIDFQYPITAILTDFSEVVINNTTEFEALSDTCNDENEEDDDIECIDFVYPITASVFNPDNEVIATVTINNDNQLYNFIDDIGNNGNVVVVQFPITVIIYDGTTIVVNNLNELEAIINDFEDDCDEDDDNDYDDDDCDDCTDTALTDLLTDCPDWMVDKLKRNDDNLEDNYDGYSFNFLADGTINVTSGSGDFSGTWSASGSGNDITVTINITGLSDFNDTWDLHEIEQEDDEAEIELRLEDDKLKFKSDCI